MLNFMHIHFMYIYHIVQVNMLIFTKLYKFMRLIFHFILEEGPCFYNLGYLNITMTQLWICFNIIKNVHMLKRKKHKKRTKD